jgi:hypothetical protein
MNLKSKLQALVATKAQELHEDISYFEFAHKTDTGFRFLPFDSRRQAALEDILNQAVREFPHKTPGQILDVLAKIVNK